MDVLETALAPLVRMVNRQIAATTPARELCNELDGRSMAVRLEKTALAACLHIRGEQLSLSLELPDDPDVIVTGSLLSLLRIPANGEQSFRDGSAEISGNAEVAEKFQRLLAYGKPDLEEELSSAIGDVAAHGIGNFVRGVGRWGRAARSTMRQNVSEYLQEESQAVPSRYEADKFSANVNSLRDDVERLEARLRDLEGRAD